LWKKELRGGRKTIIEDICSVEAPIKGDYLLWGDLFGFTVETVLFRVLVIIQGG